MSTAEIAIPINTTLPENTQVNIGAWIERLRNGLSTLEDIEDEVVHTFLEFALKAQFVEFNPYVQEENEAILIKKRAGTRQEKAVDMILNGAGTPWLRLQAEEGLAPLFQKMSQTKEASFGLIFSPPGPKSEGFKDYAYCYLYTIPAFENNQPRTIHAFALRIDDFNDQDVSNALRSLSGLGPIENIKARKNETLLTNSVVFPVGQTAPLPPDQQGNFSRYRIDTLEDLLLLIHQHLPGKFALQETERGLQGEVFQEAYQRFKKEIYGICHKLWTAAHHYDYQSQAWTKAEVLTNLARHMSLSGGSCPATMTSNNNGSAAKGETTDLKYCSSCGKFYRGETCPYCS